MKLYRHAILALILLALAFACGGVTYPVAVPTTQTIDDNAAASTVMLVAADNYLVYCGAVKVDVRTLATAAHCLRDKDKNPLPLSTPVYYITHDGYEWGWYRNAAEICARDDIRDVALLCTTMAFSSWAALKFEDLQRNEPACAMHHSLGMPYEFACGVVADIYDPAPELREYFVTIHIRPGASGSGLWDRYGQLAGIAVRFNLYTGFGLYVSSAAIIDLLQLQTGTL